MRLRIAGDRTFLLLTAILALGGLAIFFSASLGLLAREAAPFSRVAETQVGIGFLLGLLALALGALVPAKFLKRIPPLAYVFSLFLTALVFIPGLGVHLNGATRWLDIGFTTIQPAEFLKLGTVLMLAWWLGKAHGKIKDIRRGLLPLLLILGAPSAILLTQPNTSALLIILIAGGAMYFAAGAPFRDFLILGGVMLLGIVLLVTIRPYILDRVLTFIEPSRDPLDSGYQIQQSLIAIGSGGLVGRGFGQSVQKFNYLPEPAGDSVFAVFAEETGFIGSALLVLLFAAFAARGIAIAGRARDVFGGLLALGLSVMIGSQAFVNMGAMLGLVPLTGLPLPFVSHGGTALFATLAAAGIILNISARKTHS